MRFLFLILIPYVTIGCSSMSFKKNLVIIIDQSGRIRCQSQDYDRGVVRKYETTSTNFYECNKSKEMSLAENDLKQLKLDKKIGIYYINIVAETPLCSISINELQNDNRYVSHDECDNSLEMSLIKTRISIKNKKILSKMESIRLKEIEQYIEKNPESSHFKSTAISKNIQIGMPDSLVELSLGRPKTVNTTVTKMGVSSQYVYGYSRYVYFYNGKVSAYQF